MKPQQALEIYKAGQDVVVKTLCDMDAETTSLKRTVKSQEITIAKLSKNSSNSGKRPSSDDITKPKPKNKDNKKRKIGAQPGHPRHERALFPEELINDFHDHKLGRCPICNGNVIFVDAEPRIIQQVELKKGDGSLYYDP